MANYLINRAIRDLCKSSRIEFVQLSQFASSNGKDIATMIKLKEARLKSAKEAFHPDQIKYDKKMQELIPATEPLNMSLVSGVPEEHVASRIVRIYKPAKNVMQSGTNNIQHWRMSFEARERWENPLMGWTSSGDPLSNVHVEFTSKEQAIAHCEKNGWKYLIQEDQQKKQLKPKSYGVNFSWNKRTRVSTK